MNTKIEFLKQFVLHPIEIGAIGPSSKKMALAMANATKHSKRRMVVELGPGTGAFTKEIVAQLAPDSQFMCIESNKSLFQIFKKNYPHITIHHDTALNLKKHLSTQPHKNCDCIISGLPWASFETKIQDQLLDTIYDSLEDGGIFIAYSYIQSFLMPQGRRFRKQIKNKFQSIQKTPMVWTNFPPAFVYICGKKTAPQQKTLE